MKRIFLIGFLVFVGVHLRAQDSLKAITSKVFYPSAYGVTLPLRDIQPSVLKRHKKYREIPNKLKRNEYRNPDALPKVGDEVRNIQRRSSTWPVISPIVNFDGASFVTQGVAPPDPSGAIGKNHYVQMVNTALTVYDRAGNKLYGPQDLSNVFPNSLNDGDPIVLYDKMADRWFISQFQANTNEILIGISQTPDPTGAYYYYRFEMPDFPDYPKYAIWYNGYYMTANMDNPIAVAFERAELLKGNSNARMVIADIPEVASNGFYSISPASFEGSAFIEKPLELFYFYDDGWGSRSGNDAIDVWEFDLDWTVPNVASIVKTQSIDVMPFQADFDVNWNDIPQKGTNQKLDAVPGAFMYMGQFKVRNGYNSVLLCHTIDVDNSANVKAGIRWYELVDSSGRWEIGQQNNFDFPGDEHRWMGGLAMDDYGNIGLAYSVSGVNTYPSIRMTGRKFSDLNSSMTITESNVVIGSGAQTNTNRFGDYAHITLDPMDGKTFWYTGEYMDGNGWVTRIHSFKIAEDYNTDLAIIAIEAPFDGQLTSNEKPIVSIVNKGTSAASNFKIYYSINGVIVEELYSGLLNSGDTLKYTFVQGVDLSVSQEYRIQAYVSLLGDEYLINDTIEKRVKSIYEFDVAALGFISPVSGSSLSNAEQVSALIRNVGFAAIDTLPVCFVFQNNTFCDTIYGLLADSIRVIHFNQTIDLNSIGSNSLVLNTNLMKDQNLSNDTVFSTVTNLGCTAFGDCSAGDDILEIKIGSFTNTSGCGANGYTDFTNQIVVIERGVTSTLSIEVGYENHEVSLWIDFNDNLVFENDELLIADAQVSYTGNISFTVPSEAVLGSHLMRIRSAWLESSSDPCSTFDFGETEDYTVEIKNPSDVSELDLKGALVNAFYAQNQQLIYVDWSSADISFESVELMNSIGQRISRESVVLENRLEIQSIGLKPGIYWVVVSNNEQRVVRSVVVGK